MRAVLAAARSSPAWQEAQIRARVKRRGSSNPKWIGGRRTALARVRDKTYGLAIGDYEKLLEPQGGVCAVCRKSETVRFRKKRGDPPGRLIDLSVDHDHRTGVVRGLLCWRCNSVLGKIHDDARIAEAMGTYLRAHGWTEATSDSEEYVKQPIRERPVHVTVSVQFDLFGDKA